MSTDQTIIIGIHSIVEALNNSDRGEKELVGTRDGLQEIRKKMNGKINCEIKEVSSHSLQELAKKEFKELDLVYQRVPSQIFLKVDAIESKDVTWIYDLYEKKKNVKIFCLDQVSDVHNGGAILRTASFYGVDCLLVSQKGSFGSTPAFSRIASGALEHVPIVQCASLPKFLGKLKKMGITCIGFSEHAKEESEVSEKNENGICLVMGAEDTGLSHAVERVLDQKVAFKSQGNIASLNVSVASAIAMDTFFSAK